MSLTIPVVRTGSANLASVVALLRRLGVTPELTESPETVRHAERLILPGVGAFGAVMQRLDDLRLREPLAQRLAAGAPTLCICLGLQILAEASEESPGVRGLGIIRDTVRRFPRRPDLRVPQLGWNAVTPDSNPNPNPDHAFTAAPAGHAYFANSFRLTHAPQGWAAAWSDHGGPFIAALSKGDVLAAQFHPELSGPWGAGLVARWLGLPTAAPAAPPAAGHRAPPPTTTPLPRVIPCLDIRDGRVVKGVKFQSLRDAGDPVELAAAYERQGADELVILDVSATPEGRANAAHTVAAVRAVLGIPLTVGGGVRTVDDAARLLDAGADKVSVNTAAVKRPDLVREIADRFGVQCTVVAVDAARKNQPVTGGAAPRRTDAPTTGSNTSGQAWEVVITSGTERTGLDVLDWCRRVEALGAGEILLTSWDRDGTRQGYDTDLLAAACGAVSLPVIASGGVNTPADMAEGLAAGATGVLAATIFHNAEWTVAAVKRAMSPHITLR